MGTILKKITILCNFLSILTILIRFFFNNISKRTKNFQKLKFLNLITNGCETQLRTQRGITFHISTIISRDMVKIQKYRLSISIFLKYSDKIMLYSIYLPPPPHLLWLSESICKVRWFFPIYGKWQGGNTAHLLGPEEFSIPNTPDAFSCFSPFHFGAYF